jgi:hypothetical protein
VIPSLSGRIQTRILLLATVGVVWTLIVGPLLPAAAPLGDVYTMALQALLLVAILGSILWEPLYHLIQQYRWEKDWPTLFALLAGIPEGLLAFFLMQGSGQMDGGVSGPTFFWHFATVWVVVWTVASGPMRVVLIRWRFRGGRVL